MTTLTKPATSQEVLLNGGWVNDANAFSTTGDNVYATATPGKNQTMAGDFRFTINTSDIPLAATIDAIRGVVEWKLSAIVTGGQLQTWVSRNNTVISDSPTYTSTTEAQTTATVNQAVSRTDLFTANAIEVRGNCSKGSTNSALTGSIDFVRLEVDYTAATQHPAAHDSFGRTVGTGTSWGTLDDSGGDWLSSGQSQFSVGSGFGSANIASANTDYLQHLPSIYIDPQDVKVKVRLDKIPTGTGGEVQTHVRLRTVMESGAWEYRINAIWRVGSGLLMQIDKIVNGSFSGQINGSTPTVDASPLANTDYWIRAQANGTTIRAKMWKDGTAEPGTWTVTVTDSSISGDASVGIRSWANGSVTNLPILSSYSEFSVTENRVEADLIGPTNALFSPAVLVDQSVVANLISATQVFSPSILGTIGPQFISQTSVVYPPTVIFDQSVSHNPIAETLMFTPTVSLAGAAAARTMVVIIA